MPEQTRTARQSPLTNVLVLLVTAALVAGGVWLMNRGDDTAGSSSQVQVSAASDVPAPAVGEPAQDFVATTADGEEVRLSDYAGRPVWLSFVATWCSSCRAEAPDMVAVQEAAGEDLVVLSVYLSEDAATVRPFVERLGMNAVNLPDPSTEISSAYRVMAVPTHFFIDDRGILRSTHVGAMSRAQMDDEVSALGVSSVR